MLSPRWVHQALCATCVHVGLPASCKAHTCADNPPSTALSINGSQFPSLLSISPTLPCAFARRCRRDLPSAGCCACRALNPALHAVQLLSSRHGARHALAARTNPNDLYTGSPMKTLLRLLLPRSDQVHLTFRLATRPPKAPCGVRSL